MADSKSKAKDERTADEIRRDIAATRARLAAGVENLVVEDSEIDGLGTADIGIGWSNYTLRRVEIRGTCDGARTAARPAPRCS